MESNMASSMESNKESKPTVDTPEQIEESFAPTSVSLTKPSRRGPTTYLAIAGIVIGYIAAQEIALMPGTVLADINAKLGPKPYYYWVPLTGNLSSIVGWNLSGSLSDFYGRRYMLILGNIIALVGAIVCATSDQIWVLMLASCIAGFGGGCQGQASPILSEIFQRKHRGIVQGLLYISPLPFIATGTLIGQSMTKHATWRWVYFINIILTAVSGIMVVLFYHPAPKKRAGYSWSVSSMLRGFGHFDWIGCFLLAVFIAMTGLAIAWGGFGIHKWSSAAILVPLLLGWASLFFLGLWELYGTSHHIKRVDTGCHPLFPPSLFSNFRGFFLLLWVAALACFAEAVISGFWPNEIAILYTTDPFKSGRYQLAPGLGLIVGIIVAGFSMRSIKHTHLQLSAASFFMSLFIGLLATLTPNSIRPGLAYTALADFFGGAMKLLIVVSAQLAFGDEVIGTATGVLNIARGIGPAFAICFYLTILRSRVTATLPNRVAEAVLPLGLPMTSLPALLMAIASQDQAALMKVPGITPAVLETAIEATKLSYAAAFRICYYVAMATGLIAAIMAFFTKDVTPAMTDHLSVDLASSERGFLAKEQDGRNVGGEEGNGAS
ncbi:MFS general substrate transporter [Lepidopterella palustris CBS 459.81]|uniref:MFS general substrate transporter n=1 Tax=Lepidopterella palustris CBS 459.81 TaxID=1314670 RepID=A0A8E2EE00_9PEZI|nr:MFS general substrate transporter [Lepidopterella palustris CBS 459.81]